MVGKEDIRFNSDFSRLTTRFDQFYKSTANNKKLHWLSLQGNSVVQAFGSAKNLVVEMSTIQTFIVLLFNTQSSWSVQQILEELNMTLANLQGSIMPLMQSRFRILVRPSSRSDCKENGSNKHVLVPQRCDLRKSCSWKFKMAN